VCATFHSFLEANGELLGLPAYNIIYTTHPVNSTGSHYTIGHEMGTLIDHKLFYITYNAAVEKYAENIPTIQKIISSRTLYNNNQFIQIYLKFKTMNSLEIELQTASYPYWLNIGLMFLDHHCLIITLKIDSILSLPSSVMKTGPRFTSIVMFLILTSVASGSLLASNLLQMVLL
jgi:hypothetical protein